LLGDVREKLADLPDESVHCVVTSPPYFGLRDYGVAGQIGLEPTPVEFVAVMVEVFREVRRVLRKDGTLWLNLGDSYAAGPMTQRENDGERSGTTLNGRRGHVDNVVMAQRRAAVPACGRTSSGPSRTRCRRASPTAAPRRTNTCSC
jgi:hypothetical protein